jgi:hypothetical protein
VKATNGRSIKSNLKHMGISVSSICVVVVVDGGDSGNGLVGVSRRVGSDDGAVGNWGSVGQGDSLLVNGVVVGVRDSGGGSDGLDNGVSVGRGSWVGGDGVGKVTTKTLGVDHGRVVVVAHRDGLVDQVGGRGAGQKSNKDGSRLHDEFLDWRRKLSKDKKLRVGK